MVNSNARRLRWAGTAIFATSLVTLGWAGWIGASSMMWTEQVGPNGGELTASGPATPLVASVDIPSPKVDMEGENRALKKINRTPQIPVPTEVVPELSETLALPVTPPAPLENLDPPHPLIADTILEASIGSNAPSTPNAPARTRYELPVNVPKFAGRARMQVVDAAAQSLSWVAIIAARTPSEPALTEAGGIAVLRNPSSTQGVVHFLIGRQTHSLEPGQTRRFELDDIGDVRFHRGGEFGDARQKVSPGEYEFAVSDRGWDLVRVNQTSADRAQ